MTKSYSEQHQHVDIFAILREELYNIGEAIEAERLRGYFDDGGDYNPITVAAIRALNRVTGQFPAPFYPDFRAHAALR